MNGQCDIYPTARQETKQTKLEPNHQTSESHDESAPDHGPILCFLCVAKTIYWRFPLSKTQVKTKITYQVSYVFRGWNHVAQPQFAFSCNCEIHEVVSTND